MSLWKIALAVIAVIALGGISTAWYVLNLAELDPYVPMFADNCAQCHGSALQGSARGPALVGRALSGNGTVESIQDSIHNGHLELGRLAYTDALSDVEIKGLAIYIGERRLGQRFTDFQFDRAVNLPSQVITSESQQFRIETVVEHLDPMVFSIQPLPDGTILLTEKERGLSIISKQGTQSPVITGTPQTGSSVDIMGIQYGSGWLLDVAVHPQYEENGWVYLHYTHLCDDACGQTLMSASMNRLDRGRIVDGAWVDVETIWQAPAQFYQPTPDTGAGGRIAFDNRGHVYFSVGIKATDGVQDTTAQDLHLPYGKIHRVNDDGSIPLDNPYAATAASATNQEASALASIWTYGHRSPQGLEWHPQRQRVWNSEMGPRGGDELNELIRGANYGWPYHSQGLEYLGGTVERHKPKAVEFDLSQIEQTLVDITPSPAISSFIIYQGSAFTSWQGNVLIGSLKGSSLFRMVFDGKQLLHQETVIKDLARIRDIEVGADGLIYLLLETKAGSSIQRLVPVSPAS